MLPRAYVSRSLVRSIKSLVLDISGYCMHRQSENTLAMKNVLICELEEYCTQKIKTGADDMWYEICELLLKRIDDGKS